MNDLATKDLSTKEKILETALSLFSTKGYEGCGVSEIAEKSGFSKPTLYYFFTNKEGLYKAVWQENFSPFLNQLERDAAYVPNPNDYFNDVYPCLCRVVRTFFSFAQENKPFFFHAISAFTSPDTVSTSQINKDYFRQLCTLLKNMFDQMGNAHGGIKGREFQLAVTFLGLISSYITCWNILGDELNEQTVNSLVKQFMHGIF